MNNTGIDRHTPQPVTPAQIIAQLKAELAALRSERAGQLEATEIKNALIDAALSTEQITDIADRLEAERRRSWKNG
jgi:lambda repressor-like predicted transcriptional regulator